MNNENKMETFIKVFSTKTWPLKFTAIILEEHAVLPTGGYKQNKEYTSRDVRKFQPDSSCKIIDLDTGETFPFTTSVAATLSSTNLRSTCAYPASMDEFAASSRVSEQGLNITRRVFF